MSSQVDSKNSVVQSNRTRSIGSGNSERGVRADPLPHPGDGRVVEPVHHPVDLLQRHVNAEVPLQPPDAGPLAVRIGDPGHHRVVQDPVRHPLAARRKHQVEAEVPVDAAIDLVNPADDPVLLAQAAQVLDRERPARAAAARLDGGLRHLFGREKARAALVQHPGLDVLGKLPERAFLLRVHGDADMADDALADLLALADGLDDLDRLPRRVPGCLDANEHGGTIGGCGGSVNEMRPLGTTTALSGGDEKNRVHSTA